jgi:hypothetical protein
MRNQSKLHLIVIFTLIALLSLGVAAISAQDDEEEEEIAPLIDDGRVNGYDPSAPVAIYCVYDDEGEDAQLERIALLSTNPDTLGKDIIVMDVDEIAEIGYSADADTLLSEADGFSLYRATDGSFYVLSPGDFEGKVYTFNWSYGDLNC